MTPFERASERYEAQLARLVDTLSVIDGGPCPICNKDEWDAQHRCLDSWADAEVSDEEG